MPRIGNVCLILSLLCLTWPMSLSAHPNNYPFDYDPSLSEDPAGIPDDLKQLYRTAWELPMRSLIDMAAHRGAFIDQSQSLNLFMETPTIGKLSSMYLYAWKAGLKTTYYLRSRAATRINQSTASTNPFSDQDAVACSLENPESCEACD